MQFKSKVSSTVTVKLSVIPPDCDPDGDEAEKTHSGRVERTAEAFRFSGTVINRTPAAVKDGYAALDKNNLDSAMQEFNRAWRLNQKNIDAYWGAAIVMGGHRKIQDRRRSQKFQ